MTVKEIIIRALKFAGREDVAEKIEKDGEFETEELQSVETMLYCLNAVEDELARRFFPLVYEEKCYAVQGKFSFEYFMHNPVKILSVTADGKEIKYVKYSSYFTADAPVVTVKYEYSPSKKTLDGNCAFDSDKVTLKMLAAGTASEYCLINGEMKQAEFWENIYREEIDRVQRKKLANVTFSPRRWL